MVNYMLQITAELENLTNFRPCGGVNDREHIYMLKLKCQNCREETDKDTCVCLSDEIISPKRGGKTNLVQKCKFCKVSGSVKMIPGRGAPLSLFCSMEKKFSPLMAFDCHGFEPVGFTFTGMWEADSILLDESEKIITDRWSTVDINLNEATSYRQQSSDFDDWVGVTGLNSKFKKIDLGSSSPVALHVGKIGRGMSENELKYEFDQCGPIIDVKIDKTNKYNAFAFITFVDEEDAMEAVDLLNGKNDWIVTLSKSSKRKGGRVGNEFNEGKYTLSPTKDEATKGEEMVSAAQSKKMEEMLGGLRGLVKKQEEILKHIRDRGKQARGMSVTGLENAELVLKEAASFESCAKLSITRCGDLIHKVIPLEEKMKNRDELKELSHRVCGLNKELASLKRRFA